MKMTHINLVDYIWLRVSLNKIIKMIIKQNQFFNTQYHIIIREIYWFIIFFEILNDNSVIIKESKYYWYKSIFSLFFKYLSWLKMRFDISPILYYEDDLKIISI